MSDLIFILLAKTDIYKKNIFSDVEPDYGYSRFETRFQSCQNALLSGDSKNIKEQCENEVSKILRKYETQFL